jgi:hypothetical protein
MRKRIQWRFALGASPTTEGVIVTLTSDEGVCGYGYGSATPHMGATQSSPTAALERFAPLPRAGTLRGRRNRATP